MTITPENRETFETMGAAGVRTDMITGNFIKNRDMLDQAHEWLKENESNKDRLDTLRFWSMVILTAIAAIAACIAAWPVIKG